MCLYPRLIRNKKYLPTKKNNYTPPEMKDGRVKYVAVGCGQCIECRTQKSREWQVRLHEELKENPHAYFVTLSFAPKSIKKLADTYNIDDVNTLATKALRLYLERWRKKYKKSIRHWVVTELGHTNTERIHLHGIFWCDDKQVAQITKKWQYGNTWIGDYCSARTINYIVKYMLKIDEIHPDYKSIVLCSAGLGKKYADNVCGYHNYRPRNTIEFYTLSNGVKINLPIYYRNKLFTEEEKEQLWLERMDKEEIYVRGVKFDISNEEGRKHYEHFLKEQQEKNIELGYGDDTKKWNKKNYKITLKMLQKGTRTQ